MEVAKSRKWSKLGWVTLDYVKYKINKLQNPGHCKASPSIPKPGGTGRPHRLLRLDGIPLDRAIFHLPLSIFLSSLLAATTICPNFHVHSIPIYWATCTSDLDLSNEGFLHERRVSTGIFTLAENILRLMFLQVKKLKWRNIELKTISSA